MCPSRRKPARGPHRRQRAGVLSASVFCACAAAFFALSTIGINESGAGLRPELRAVGWFGGHLYFGPAVFQPLGGAAAGAVADLFMLVAVMGLSLYLSYASRLEFRPRSSRHRPERGRSGVLGVPTPLYKALVLSTYGVICRGSPAGSMFFKSAFIPAIRCFDLSLSTEAIVIAMLGRAGDGHRRGARRLICMKSCAATLLTPRPSRTSNSWSRGVLCWSLCCSLPGRAQWAHLKPLSAHAKGARMTAPAGSSKRSASALAPCRRARTELPMCARRESSA